MLYYDSDESLEQHHLLEPEVASIETWYRVYIMLIYVYFLFV